MSLTRSWASGAVVAVDASNVSCAWAALRADSASTWSTRWVNSPSRTLTDR